jgi:hypothetical protein
VTALEISAAVTVRRIGVPPPVGVAIISYSIIAEPPVTVAAPIVTDADVAVAADAVTEAGAPGTVAGVTAADATDALEPPLALFATTLYVYAVPLVSPVTSHEVAGAVAVQVPATVTPSGP